MTFSEFCGKPVLLNRWNRILEETRIDSIIRFFRKNPQLYRNGIGKGSGSPSRRNSESEGAASGWLVWGSAASLFDKLKARLGGEAACLCACVCLSGRNKGSASLSTRAELCPETFLSRTEWDAEFIIRQLAAHTRLRNFGISPVQ